MLFKRLKYWWDGFWYDFTISEIDQQHIKIEFVHYGKRTAYYKSKKSFVKYLKEES